MTASLERRIPGLTSGSGLDRGSGFCGDNAGARVWARVRRTNARGPAAVGAAALPAALSDPQSLRRWPPGVRPAPSAPSLACLLSSNGH